MEILVLAVMLGLIPAAIAHNKGHNFWLWWIFGALLWIVATPMAILLKRYDAQEQIERRSEQDAKTAEWVTRVRTDQERKRAAKRV